ncbi:MAG: endonuclease/exonuclease/phosphatase family protein [Spirochaetaceae bacterium]
MIRVFVLLLVILTSCCLPQSDIESEITIMSWNVQNLFDGNDDGDEYDSFSVAKGMWSENLYTRRLELLSKIILLNKPDIIAFQEIEGLKVLQDLQNDYLSEYRYLVSTDTESAIELGFLSKYSIDNVGFIDPNSDSYGLRPLLEVTFNIDGNELVVINNHWKSKAGAFSEHLRIESSVALKKRILELQDSEVVVLGDLNENYNEYQLRHKSFNTALMYNEVGDGITIKDSTTIENDQLYTVWPDSEFPGSYNYKGSWETIDHFLLNSKLLDDEGFNFIEFSVDSRDILFSGSGDVKKWITDLGIGYSDHLPIILSLGVESVETTLE